MMMRNGEPCGTERRRDRVFSLHRPPRIDPSRVPPGARRRAPAAASRVRDDQHLRLRQGKKFVVKQFYEAVRSAGPISRRNACWDRRRSVMPRARFPCGRAGRYDFIACR
jgi:hypothetical protein